MSKLTNAQLRDTIEGMQCSLERDERRGRGNTASARHRQQQIEAYRSELAAREAAGADPRTHELQSVSHGESA